MVLKNINFCKPVLWTILLCIAIPMGTLFLISATIYTIKEKIKDMFTWKERG